MTASKSFGPVLSFALETSNSDAGQGPSRPTRSRSDPSGTSPAEGSPSSATSVAQPATSPGICAGATPPSSTYRSFPTTTALRWPSGFAITSTPTTRSPPWPRASATSTTSTPINASSSSPGVPIGRRSSSTMPRTTSMALKSPPTARNCEMWSSSGADPIPASKLPRRSLRMAQGIASSSPVSRSGPPRASC
ncbi:hypothetical protein D3C86_1405290 [compost metagenome]